MLGKVNFNHLAKQSSFRAFKVQCEQTDDEARPTINEMNNKLREVPGLLVTPPADTASRSDYFFTVKVSPKLFTPIGRLEALDKETRIISLLQKVLSWQSKGVTYVPDCEKERYEITNELYPDLTFENLGEAVSEQLL